MNLTRKSMGTWLVMLALVFTTGCGGLPMKPAIHLDPGFRPKEIDLITILPAIDGRFDKKIKVNLEKQLNKLAKQLLKRRRYEAQIVDNYGAETQITKDDLKSGDAEWIKKLGPSDANWVMVLVLDDVVTKLTFGSTGNAEVSGFLFDKETGTLVWRDKATGKAGQGGLIGMAMKGMMNGQAILFAVDSLITSIPGRPKSPKNKAGESS